ncbi:TRAP transporter large permease [Bosea sp. (in: a-proteobacteria)]|uniref:TRAP transporter large permease n=1 Tax=Bosea sp. (in: a-proteobacteria) TaxID=1871050 RepID=UPI001AC89096|nr:TRAP transporter large permease [Bosea sp. (in: a-proteobacteria)]MBN9437440.1 TRAP transporter large permease [Bosea sp. (in: a-proteobacteria)]
MLANASLLLAILIGASLPIAATLIICALLLSAIYSPLPLFLAASEIFWKVSTEFTLTSVPLFILLGEILLRAGIAERMYGAVALWLNRLPGGLLHANIGASTLFAATSGSSVATAATIGTVALPEVRRRGYNERLFLGSLAAGGTLGILIPPSIHLIIYGMITNTSVPKLYLAAAIPGLLLAALFSLIIVVICMAKPGFGGEPIKATWRQRFTSLVDLVPILLLFLVVIGSIYAGFATPTEAASLGLVFAVVLAWWYGKLSLALLHESFIGAMKATAMIMLIVLASYFLNFVLSVIGLSQQLTSFISGLGLSPLQTMLVIIAFFVVLGCFLESLSMLVTITPLVAPIVIGLGYDPIWFGVILTILLELALITPPVGINLYVVQAIRGRGSIQDVIAGSLIFVVSMFALIGLLLAFPAIAMWLPTHYGD